MSYTFACGDVVPGCTTQFMADTREEILVQVTGHAAADHDVASPPPELVAAVNAAIRET
jgi:predicted small metal-binding protein